MPGFQPLNNQMPYPLWFLLAKNISKIPQLIFIGKSGFHFK
jgi:hypothetical protein